MGEIFRKKRILTDQFPLVLLSFNLPLYRVLLFLQRFEYRLQRVIDNFLEVEVKVLYDVGCFLKIVNDKLMKLNEFKIFGKLNIEGKFLKIKNEM